jgi:tetratricopeptide (TPR) repeat protein
MRPDHRHELKTNELAEWIMTFPQWARENMTFLIGTAAVCVVAAALYFGLFYRKNIVLAHDREVLTSLVTQLPFQKIQVIQGQTQGKEQSYMLVAAANNLRDFAQGAKDDRMAAVALIERAEALRAELHYRIGNVTRDEIAQQIGQAKESYEEALRRASSSASLTAQAKYGLGLCEEELGNFDDAERIYREVAHDPNFAGTVTKVAAAHRLKTMSDYKKTIVFRPAPQIPTFIPELLARQADVNMPPIAPKESEPNIVIQPAKPTAEMDNKSAQNPPAGVADSNTPHR